jgi:hypothetical protein
VRRVLDAAGLNYEGVPTSIICRSCLMQVALPLPLDYERDESVTTTG